MKKKIALTVASLFLMSSMAFAAPMTEYEAGKISIDLTFRGSKNSTDWSGGFKENFDRKYNFEPSITVGVAEGLAVQFRNTNAKSKNTNPVNILGESGTSKIRANEFNVLYSVAPNASVFVGYVNSKVTNNYDDFGFEYSVEGKNNTYQLGVLGSMPFSDRFSGYGVLAIGGKSWRNYELGVSYGLSDDMDFNVSYRHIESNFVNADVKAKGFGFGITYRFN